MLLRKTGAIAPRRIVLGLGTALTLVLSACVSAAPAPDGKILTERVPAPADAMLHTVIYLPEGPGPFPTLVLRSPYEIPSPPPGGLVAEEDNDDEEPDPVKVRASWESVLAEGYAVVMQNSRGRHASGGVDALFGTEREDGAALAAWVIAQPWSNGVIGVLGDSADGFNGHLMMASDAPGVRAGFFQVSCGRLLTDGVVRKTGGLQMETLVPWLTQEAFGVGAETRASLSAGGASLEKLQRPAERSVSALFSDNPTRRAQAFAGVAPATIEPLRSLQPGWPDFIGEATYPKLSRYFDTAPDIKAPVMQVALWQDAFADCSINQHQLLSARSPEHRLLVFNGTHYEVDEPATWPVKPMLDWFGHHLKGEPLPTYLSTPVSYTVENAAAPMALRSSAAWPPVEATAQEMYLQPGGTLSEASPAGEQILTRVETDPSKLVPTLGGRNLLLQAGGVTQRRFDASQGTLFASPTLREDQTIAGPIEIDLVLVPAQPDTDIVARVVSIAPDGSNRLLVENLFRGRYREGRENPKPLSPGSPISVSFLIGHLAHRIPAGHRLGVILQGSNAPRWDVSGFADVDPALSVATGIASTTVITTPRFPARLRYTALPG